MNTLIYSEIETGMAEDSSSKKNWPLKILFQIKSSLAKTVWHGNNQIGSYGSITIKQANKLREGKHSIPSYAYKDQL